MPLLTPAEVKQPLIFQGDMLPHDSLKVNIIVACVLTWVLAAVSVGLRLYTRSQIIRVIGPSDWVLVASLVCSAALSVCAIFEAEYGIGSHVWDIDPTKLPDLLLTSIISLVFYAASLFLTKVAILLLYMRVFTYDWVRVAGRLILFIVVLSNVWSFGVIFTSCIPLRAYWDVELQEDPNTYCHPQSFYWVNTGLHMVTDFLIFALPLPAVYRLNMPPKQKLMAMGVFAIGFLVCIISVLRLVNVIEGFASFDDPTRDHSYVSAITTYWTVTEINLAIFVASVMTLKPLLVSIFPRLLGPSTQANGLRIGRLPLTVGSKPTRRFANRGADERDDSMVLITAAAATAEVEDIDAELKRREVEIDLEAGHDIKREYVEADIGEMKGKQRDERYRSGRIVDRSTPEKDS